MKIDIIGIRRPTWENKRLIEEFEKKGFSSEFIDPRKISYVFENNKVKLFYKSKPYVIPDAVLCRGGFISKIEDAGRLFIHVLEEMNVLLIEKPHPINRDKDKLLFSMIFAKHNIPHPDTYLLRYPSLLKLINFSPVIVKHQRGKQGRNLFKVDKLVKLPSKNYFFQKMLSNSHVDKRVFVVGGRVVGGMQRKATRKGEWRSNFSLGAKVSKVILDSKIKKLAIKAAKACHYDIAGVDILTDASGKDYVIEVNRAPQFKGLEQATGINVSKSIIDFVVKKLKNNN